MVSASNDHQAILMDELFEEILIQFTRFVGWIGLVKNITGYHQHIDPSLADTGIPAFTACGL